MKRQRRSEKPWGILAANFEQLHEAGCIQTGADLDPDKWNYIEWYRLWEGLMRVSNNNPCDGCPAWKGGKCCAFLRYHTQPERNRGHKNAATIPPGTPKHPGLSVRQIATRLGVSISEVRRRKVRGTV